MAPLFSHIHPALPAQEGAWAPRFLQQAEVETVTLLAERIIPETDTPGAGRALVHQYVDFVLSQAGAPVRERFRRGLAWLDGRSASLFGKPFARLEADEQDQILRSLSEAPSGEEPTGVAFFGEAKRLTIDGYYRSEVGMTQELGFEGRTFLAEFKGCTHPEHHSSRLEE